MSRPITEEMLDELRQNIVKTMSSKRARHTLEVEKMAVRLAKRIVRDYAKVEKIEKVRLKEYENRQKDSDKKE